jgi:hypothetical protein
MHAKVAKSHNVTIRNYRTPNKWRRLHQATTEVVKGPIWIEIPQPALFNKMAYAEQQRWITVQQKTFTKWLNTKLEVRNLEVKDLVQDLSDGVCISFPFKISSFVHLAWFDALAYTEPSCP